MVINGKQSVKLRCSSINFKNHFKQTAILFKSYTNSECNVKGDQSNNRDSNTPYTKKHHAHIPCSFA